MIDCQPKYVPNVFSQTLKEETRFFSFGYMNSFLSDNRFVAKHTLTHLVVERNGN